MSWSSNRPGSNASTGGEPGGPVAIGDITDWPAGVSATEVGYLDGATSALQTQIDGKEPTITTLPKSKGGFGASIASVGDGILRFVSGALQAIAQLGVSQGGTGSDLSATGGSGHYLKQASAGAAVTVGAIAAGDLPTGIDAAKIADGSVSNAEFQRLNGVTSDIQTQLDSKASAAQLTIFRRATTDQTGLSGSYAVSYLDYNSEVSDPSNNWTRTSAGVYRCDNAGTYIVVLRIHDGVGLNFFSLELAGSVLPGVVTPGTTHGVMVFILVAAQNQELKFHFQSSSTWTLKVTDGGSRVGVNEVGLLKVA